MIIIITISGIPSNGVRVYIKEGRGEEKKNRVSTCYRVGKGFAEKIGWSAIRPIDSFRGNASQRICISKLLLLDRLLRTRCDCPPWSSHEQDISSTRNLEIFPPPPTNNNNNNNSSYNRTFPACRNYRSLEIPNCTRWLLFILHSLSLCAAWPSRRELSRGSQFFPFFFSFGERTSRLRTRARGIGVEGEGKNDVCSDTKITSDSRATSDRLVIGHFGCLVSALFSAIFRFNFPRLVWITIM